ncbi:thiamine-phosphate pyrophosphorylase [Amorphus suaedae]
MVDVRVYVILDPEHAEGRPLAELARLAVDGGATLLQYRDKTAETGELVATARAILSAIEGSGVPLLINDRIDVALAAGADGVHIGQTDMAPDDARRLLGPDPVVGLTVRSMAEAEAVPVKLVDYVGIGGVFATSSKQNRNAPIGLDGLAEICAFLDARAPDLGRVAIAGITADTAASVIAAGAEGVAVISAVSKAADPAAAAGDLRHIVDTALTSGKTATS